MLDVGFGSAVITPPTPVQLAGFAEDQPATEVHDDLEVRAMYLRGQLGAVCLVVCDLLGMSRSFARPVRESVAAALGLDLGAVLTSCVHTHAGPSTIAGSEALGWVTPEGYRELLVEQCTAAARAAAAAAVPASLRAGRFPLPEELSINRRGLPYEPTFAVLDAIAPDGARVGTLANVAIHPVALGPECLAVSSDWVGSFRRRSRRVPAGPRCCCPARSATSTRTTSTARTTTAVAMGSRRPTSSAATWPRPSTRRSSHEHVETDRPDGRAGAHHRRDHGRNAAHRQVRRGGRVDRARRVVDRSGAPRVGARRGLPRPRA